MKHLALVLATSLSTFIAIAQNKPAATTKKIVPATAAKKTTTPVSVKPTATLKNATDSLSYAIGILDGNFFKTQGLSNISPAALGQGFNDVIKGNTLFSAEQADQIVRTELQKNSRKKSPCSAPNKPPNKLTVTK